MAKMSSSAGMFAKKGDPWVTEREGIKQFARNPETEDPDLDHFLRAEKAKEKEAFVDPPRPKKGPVGDRRVRLANISRVMRMKMYGVGKK